MTRACHEGVQEVERLADQLEALLAFITPSLRYQYQKAIDLSHWADCYKEGLHYGILATEEDSEHQKARLIGFSDRMKLEDQELHRMQPMSDEEGAVQPETENFIESAKRLIRESSLGPDRYYGAVKISSAA